jgi:TonB family protein
VHGGLAAALIAVYVHDFDTQRRPPARVGRAQAQPAPLIQPDAWRDSEFGERTGQGEALNSLAGLEPYLGRKGPQDQAPLSRDPIGNGQLADDPQKATALKEGVDAPMPASIAGDSGSPAPFGVADASEMKQPALVAKPPLKAVIIEEKPPAPQPSDIPVVAQKVEEKAAVAVAVAQAEKTPHPALSPRSSGEGKNAENRPAAVNTGGIAGDPSPMSESESDAFSRMGTIQVRNGRVDARLGRDFKSVKPRLSLKGELDAISIAKPVVEMSVLVDETGKVIDVKVLRSSGSNEIDLPTTTAMYKWWIEPAKNKQGKPVKDVILVTFSYL